MEEQITFNAFSDKNIYAVESDDGTGIVAEISGYDLQVKFDLSKINTLEDAENACETLSKVFFKALFQQLLEDRANNNKK